MSELTDKEVRELWVLLHLREALGDPTGKLMHDELIECARNAWTDAQRYRYLRNRDPRDGLHCAGPSAGCWIDTEEAGDPGEPYPLMLLTGDDADAAIDAAMGRPKPVSDA